jgi:2-polyprenyl-3-methyl-5-hydroxy-6-metoxy-1,4-benzoquinol methylase
MSRNRSNPSILTTVPHNLKELILDTWNRQSANWPDYIDGDDFHQASLRETRNVLLKLASTRITPPSVVDLGCGSGLFLRSIRQGLQWKKLLGLDHCKPALERARSMNVTGEPEIRFRQHDIESGWKSTAHPGRFDFAVATFVIDEIENIAAFFHTAITLLEPDGRLICAMLDETRERHRHSLATFLEPVIVKQTKTNSWGVNLEYYRIIRSQDEAFLSAAQAGLKCDHDRTLSPSELRSRVDGPSLRLIVFSPSHSHPNAIRTDS